LEPPTNRGRFKERGEINRSKLGWLLKKNANRIVGGFEFQQAEADGRTAWQVVAVKTPPLAPSPPFGGPIGKTVPKQNDEAASTAPKRSRAEQVAPGVPFMITQAMRAQLRDLGYTADAIAAMTPGDAWQILSAATRQNSGGVDAGQPSELEPKIHGWRGRL
jgi:hypothetical protein